MGAKVEKTTREDTRGLMRHWRRGKGREGGVGRMGGSAVVVARGNKTNEEMIACKEREVALQIRMIACRSYTHAKTEADGDEI